MCVCVMTLLVQLNSSDNEQASGDATNDKMYFRRIILGGNKILSWITGCEGIAIHFKK